MISLRSKRFISYSFSHQNTQSIDNQAFQNMIEDIHKLETQEEIFKYLEARNYDLSLPDLLSFLQKIIKLTKDLKTLPKKYQSQIKSLTEEIRAHLDLLIEEEATITTNFHDYLEQSSEQERSQKLTEWAENVNNKEIDQSSKFPKLGSLTKVLSYLEISDPKIWQKIIRMINLDRYNASFEENISALEGFTYYQEIHKKVKKSHLKKMIPVTGNQLTGKIEYKDDLTIALDRLEWNASKTMWEENQVKYLRTVKALYKLGRTDNKKFYQKIEDKIILNLLMDYKPETILETAYYFALSGNGSPKLFSQLQRVLYLGKPQNNQLKDNAKIIQLPLMQSEQNLIMITEVFNYAKREYGAELCIDQEFNNLVINLAKKKKFELNLGQIASLTNLLYQNLKIEGKILEDEGIPSALRDSAYKSFSRMNNLEEASQFMEVVGLLNFDDHEIKAFVQLIEAALKDGSIKIQTPEKAISFNSTLQESGYLKHFQDQQVWEHTLKSFFNKNYPRMKSHQLRIMMDSIEQLQISKSGKKAVIGDQTNTEYSKVKNKMLKRLK